MIILHSDRTMALFGLFDRIGTQATMAGALYAEKEIKESMSKPKTGRIYNVQKISKKGKKSLKVHQASAPGEPPAIDTGALVNSIKAERVGTTDARTFTNNEQAPHLEYGTVKMPARPFMTPAGYKAVEFMDKYIDKALKNELGVK